MHLSLAALWILLSVVSLVALRYGLLFELLLRLRIEPGRAVTLRREKIPRAVRQLLDFALPQLESLGFSRSVSLAVWGVVVTVRNRPMFIDTYYDGHAHCHAWVSLADDPERGALLSVDFQTCYADGRSLLTYSRRLHTLSELSSAIIAHEDHTDSPEERFRAHMTRRGEYSAIEIVDDPAEAWRRFQEQLASYQLFLEDEGILRSGPQPGQRRLSMRGAAGLLLRIAPGLRSIRRVRQASIRKDAPMKMRILADGVAYSRSLTASTVASHDWVIKMLAVLGSALLGAQAWGVEPSWLVVAAVVAVLAFHEGCHFAAMHLCGHREDDVYCIPLPGTASNLRNETATVWQRLFVYLAGPLPGVALGVLCIDFAAHIEGPLRLWLLPLGAVALGINLFNLLPFPALDGGRLVESLACGRVRHLRPALLALAMLLLVASGAYLRMPVLMVLGMIFAFALPAEWGIAELAAATRTGGGEGGERKRALPAVFRALAKDRRRAGLGFPKRVELAKAVLPLVIQRPPPPAHTASALIVYAIVLAAPIAAYLAL